MDKGVALDEGRGPRTAAGTRNFGDGYNRNAAKLILIEVQKKHGQAAVDGLIREFEMSELFGFRPDTQIKL